MRPKIIMIGAGICGLTTAISIGEAVAAAPDTYPVHPDITILEAESQAGGRACTETLSNGLHVDVGPHWFHGGEKNKLFQWAKARYGDKLGAYSIDTAKRRFNVQNKKEIPVEKIEWANTRLFQLYSEWKARYPDDDISLHDLAALSKSPDLMLAAEERATNWMSVDSANLVSSIEFFGDETSSGGVQLENGIGHLIDLMKQEAEYFGADIRLNTEVSEVKSRKGGGFIVTDSRGHTYEADDVLVTVSAAVLKSGAIKFSDAVHRKLDPVLAGIGVARMTKIFIPLRPEYFEGQDIKPDTFAKIYDQKHSWLSHLGTDGNPLATVFACGAVSKLVEEGHRTDIEQEILQLLERNVPALAGVSDNVDGRIHMTSWSTNPHFLGAYSAMLPGYARSNPLHCGVIFAGEAFVKNLKHSPSQMAGAHMSGRMVAKSLLRRLGGAQA